MSKDSKKRRFLDFFNVKDSDDDYDDDFFDDDDDDYDDDDLVSNNQKAKSKQNYSATSSYQQSSKPSYSKNTSASNSSYTTNQYQSSYQGNNYTQNNYKKPQKTTQNDTNKLVSIDSQKRQSNYKATSEVYVIKPVAFDDAQTVADFLKSGKTIVINMEGVQLDPAQRIIDFIGGACYGIGGELSAISSNIFIAAPDNIEVSGDLREEIFTDSNLSPQLGRY